MKEMRLDIEPPLHGWTKIQLTSPGFRLEFTASNRPWDSIGDLARATAGLLTGLPEQIVVWNTEPMEYEFCFAAGDGRTRMEVHEYPDRRRRWRHTEIPVSVVEGDTINIIRAIWRGLRRLQGAVSSEAFAAAWGHPFPACTVEQIGEQLKGQPEKDIRIV